MEKLSFMVLDRPARLMSDTLGSMWTMVLRAPLSLGFSSQEQWIGQLFPFSGALWSGVSKVSQLRVNFFYHLSHKEVYFII